MTSLFDCGAVARRVDHALRVRHVDRLRSDHDHQRLDRRDQRVIPPQGVRIRWAARLRPRCVAHPGRLAVPRRLHRVPPLRHPPVPTRLPSTGDDVVTLLLNRDGLPAGLLIGRRHGSTLTHRPRLRARPLPRLAPRAVALRPRCRGVPRRRHRSAAQRRHDRHPPQVSRTRRLPTGRRPIPISTNSPSERPTHVCVQFRVTRVTRNATQTDRGQAMTGTDAMASAMAESGRS